MTKTRALGLAVVGCFAVALWLSAFHIHVSHEGGTQDWGCGGAYRAAQNDYGGGEKPPDIDALEAACHSKGKKLVVASASVAMAGVVILVPFVFALRPWRRPQREGRPSLLR